MAKRRGTFLLIFCVFLSVLQPAFSQIIGDEANNNHHPYIQSATIDLLAPRFLQNSDLKHTFDGIYSIHGALNYFLSNNYFLGITLSNSLFRVPPNTYFYNNNSILSTSLQVNSVGLNLGHDNFFSKIGFLSTVISIGESNLKYNYLAEPTPVPIQPNVNAPYAQFSTSMNFMVESHVAIGILIRYTYVDYNFDPSTVALNQVIPYASNVSKGNTGILELGFSIYTGFIKKKKL